MITGNMALLRVLCSSTWALLLVNDIHQPHLSLNANKIATVGKQTSMAETVWSMIVLGCYLLAISQLLVNAQENTTTNDNGETGSAAGDIDEEEIKGYLSKFELGMSSSEVSPICLNRNGVSKPINIPIGLPMGSSTRRKAYVGTNGAISFERPFYSRWPSPFPARGWWNRRSRDVVAPFWSDNDIRISGQVCYEVHDEETDYLTEVNQYISMKTKKEFNGKWMLLAEWDKVHPYPYGNWWWSWYGSKVKEFTQKENTYQAIVVTDGLTSYSLFTYQCNEMQWSGYWRHATVGYNADGNFYTNHPLTGYPQVKDLGCLGSESSDVNNLLYRISLDPDYIQKKRVECRNMLRMDEEALGDVTPFAEQLQPCPCSWWQARRDRRYRSDWNSWYSGGDRQLCYRERFPNIENDGSQYCCYRFGWPSWGSLKRSKESGSYSTNMLRYHPRYSSNYQTYDRALRETCCTIAGLCDEFYQRRPQNDCRGYIPQRRRWGGGDPHITSLDGLSYTFNGLGEYRLMEIDQYQFTMQGRTGRVEGSTKATEFVALAFAVGTERVEIQNINMFSVFHNSSNITNDLSEVNDTYTNSYENIEMSRNAENSLEITFQFGLSVTVNISVGILHYTLAMPDSLINSTISGLLGNFNGNEMDDVISPNGTFYNASNEKDVFNYGETWKVLSNSASIFMVPNPDPDPSFIPDFVQDVIKTASQEVLDACNGDTQCIYDAVQTNNLEVGLATTVIQQNLTKEVEEINNFPPVINGSTTFELTVDKSMSYTFSVTDTDSFNVTVESTQLINGYTLSDNNDGTWTFQCTWTLNDTRNFTVSFVATDSFDSSANLEPKIIICGCINDGTCTNNAESSTNPVILSCECDEEVWSGEFCEEDTNGCEDFDCYPGVECYDNPAPQQGASCGDCPIGLSGDGSTCDDIDECENGLCEQGCTNTEGSYFCECFEGYLLTDEGSCQDINECEGYNDCHQECTNTVGSYECGCIDGFILSSDKRACTAQNPCSQSYSLPILCAIVGGEETFACTKGFSLSTGNSICEDTNECQWNVCDQLCQNTFGSFECACRGGFYLAENKKSCIDIDECLKAALNNTQLCSNDQMMCINTAGGYKCDCPDGTEHDTINERCVIPDPSTTTLQTMTNTRSSSRTRSLHPSSTVESSAPSFPLSNEAIIGIGVGAAALIVVITVLPILCASLCSRICKSKKVIPLKQEESLEQEESIELLPNDIAPLSSRAARLVSVQSQRMPGEAIPAP